MNTRGHAPLLLVGLCGLVIGCPTLERADHERTHQERTHQERTSDATGEVERGRARYIFDGDTISVTHGGRQHRVRYIGIDSPEVQHRRDPQSVTEPFGEEARALNEELVRGKNVRLVSDQQDHDRYGRDLRYVYLDDGTFVNLEIVRRGFARALTIRPNTRHAEAFREAEREARAERRGMWAAR